MMSQARGKETPSRRTFPEVRRRERIGIAGPIRSNALAVPFYLTFFVAVMVAQLPGEIMRAIKRARARRRAAAVTA